METVSLHLCAVCVYPGEVKGHLASVSHSVVILGRTVPSCCNLLPGFTDKVLHTVSTSDWPILRDAGQKFRFLCKQEQGTNYTRCGGKMMPRTSSSAHKDRGSAEKHCGPMSQRLPGP